MAKILLVEDEADLRFSLVHNLGFEGFSVEEAADGAEGLAKSGEDEWDLIILDIMLPKLDGISVLKGIRQQDPLVPIMILTAKSTEMDKVIGFELGADDYLTKPFSLGEFLARVKALLRRNRAPRRNARQQVSFFGVDVDMDNFSVKKDGEDVHFSQKEFLLLRYLIQHPDEAVEKSEILKAVWGYDTGATTRTIDTHIARIRRKLGDQDQNRIIQTVPTVGYKFVAERDD